MPSHPPQPPHPSFGNGAHGPGFTSGTTGTGTSPGATGGTNPGSPGSQGMPADFLAFAHLPGVWFRENEVVPLPSQDVVWERLIMEVVTPQGQQIVMQRTRTWPPLACGIPLGHWSEIRECGVSTHVVHVVSTQQCMKCGRIVWKPYTAPRYDIYGRSAPVCFMCLEIIDAPSIWDRLMSRLPGKGVWW